MAATEVGTIEVELKFQVPAASRAGLRRALATASATRVHLQAVYADTADDRLAAAGLALRLRKEGRRWVQTLKARGDGLMQRPEHEVALPPQRGTPGFEPARHAGTAVGDRLAELLADGAALVPRYRTDVHRLQRRLRSGGATIDVAFDEGRISAGARHLPVCELELELHTGRRVALLALAERWALRHGLWLDVRSKSERGHRLALGLDRVPATPAAAAILDADTSPDPAFAAMLNAALAHLLPNLAEVASGTAAPEHLHQARVALRRMRTALRLFGAWSADPAAALALEQRCGETFGRLGAARDIDALAATLLPALAAAGAPALVLPPPPGAEPPQDVLREASVTATLLRLMQLALAEPVAASSTIADSSRAVLRLAWRRLLADAASFAEAGPEHQHRTRRRLKRLRYATEFLLPALPAKPARRALDAMRSAIDALGSYTDVLTAIGLFQTQAADHPPAWFALGWLAAQRGRLERRAARQLAGLAKAQRFWP